MRQLQTMAVLAVGMTFGLACGDTARMLLPPDAGAQADGGGTAERPASRVIEAECDPDTLKVSTGDALSAADLMVAHVWLCGRESNVSGAGVTFPVGRCVPKTHTIEDGALVASCGDRNGDDWARAIVVRIVVP